MTEEHISSSRRMDDLCDTRNMKLQKLASITGISYGAMRKWVSQEMEIPSKYIPQIAQALDTTCDYLLTGVDAAHQMTARGLGLSDSAIRVLRDAVSIDRLFKEYGTICEEDHPDAKEIDSYARQWANDVSFTARFLFSDKANESRARLLTKLRNAIYLRINGITVGNVSYKDERGSTGVISTKELARIYDGSICSILGELADRRIDCLAEENRKSQEEAAKQQPVFKSSDWIDAVYAAYVRSINEHEEDNTDAE